MQIQRFWLRQNDGGLCNELLRRRAGLLLALSAVLGAAASSVAQTTPVSVTADGAQLLIAAGTSAIPETDSTPPFHLLGSFETFDYQGKPEGKGTLEIYWDGKGSSRHNLTYRGQTQTQIKTSSTYTTVEQFASSLSERTLLQGFLAPVPAKPSTVEGAWVVKPATISGVAMDCVSATPRPVPKGISQVATDVPVYCVSPQPVQLRMAQLPNNLTLVYNKLEALGPRTIAHKMTLSQGAIVRGRLTIDKLDIWVPDTAIFVPPPGATTRLLRVRMSGGVIAGSILEKEQPSYPISARQSHVTGSVVMGATISEAGTVENLEVISSPDDRLSYAAMESVKKWRYKPYILNGEPVEVDTTITVNFNIGHP